MNPKYARAYFNRGLAFHKKGEIDHATADLGKASKLNPKLDEEFLHLKVPARSPEGAALKVL